MESSNSSYYNYHTETSGSLWSVTNILYKKQNKKLNLSKKDCWKISKILDVSVLGSPYKTSVEALLAQKGQRLQKPTAVGMNGPLFYLHVLHNTVTHLH